MNGTDNSRNQSPQWWRVLFALKGFLLALICLIFALSLTQCPSNPIQKSVRDYDFSAKFIEERANTKSGNNNFTDNSNASSNSNVNLSVTENSNTNSASNINNTNQLSDNINKANQLATYNNTVLWFYGLQLASWTAIIGMLIWGAITLIRED